MSQASQNTPPAVYYRDNSLLIRTMIPSDAQILADEELKQGWNATPEKYNMRLRDQAEGKCLPLVAEYEGNPSGYINVYFHPQEGPFAGTGWPVIVDFGVLEKYRRRGIGTKLMDTAEQIAARYADTVWLGVGLHNGYGAAQRMYVKRGYIPDGSGVWYRNRPCTPYDTVYTNDDDMELYLSKKITRTPDGSHKGHTAGDMAFRQANPEDILTVTALASALWPHADRNELSEEYAELLSSAECGIFLAEQAGQPAGFAQCQLRHDYVEGAKTSPVGYLEGIYVADDFRGQGIARALLKQCEQWAVCMGCSEFASDCELDNAGSRAFHLRMGFRESNRIICFIKPLMSESAQTGDASHEKTDPID